MLSGAEPWAPLHTSGIPTSGPGLLGLLFSTSLEDFGHYSGVVMTHLFRLLQEGELSPLGLAAGLDDSRTREPPLVPADSVQ